MKNRLRHCIIVPCYEAHAKKLSQTILGLIPFEKDIIIIDDGSSEKFAELISEIAEEYNCKLLVNPCNGGKGSAIKNGMLYAKDQGYTHALQIDSDGQHDLSAVDEMISLSLKYPKLLISGRPLYDESVPKVRLWGRYLTHIWVWIETLSFQLKDSMCGFRCYPIIPSVQTIERDGVGSFMDFDTEIMVKLYWRGTRSHFFPVKVMYPKDGTSYFRGLEDNWLISKMHTRLFFGMIFRIPKILFQRKKWNEQNEKGTIFLIRFVLWLHGIIGNSLTRFIIRFIAFYYFLFSPKARRVSSLFFKECETFSKKVGRRDDFRKITPYKHILSFSNMFLDKILIWKGKICEEDFSTNDREHLYEVGRPGHGGVFISSHYGNVELSRGLGEKKSNIKSKAIIYTKNSEKMFHILKKIDPLSIKNIIPVEKFGPEVGILLEDCISKGEWIFCMGDRITEKSEKVVRVMFLGRETFIPKGPFLLSYLLKAPVYSFHCYRDEGEIRIQTREITPSLELSRENRERYIQSVAEEYIKDLEELVLNDPLQWFNFYDYWNQDEK